MFRPTTFTITYWGTAGSFCSPLLPQEVTDKIVTVIHLLVERGAIAKLEAGPALDRQIRHLLDAEVPFEHRSTFGGNTTCVEVQTPDELFILDCGSGFRELGLSLEKRWHDQGEAAERRAHILLTHGHIDHTFGTPFFDPYYNPQNSFTLYGPQTALESLTVLLDPSSAFSKIYFPPTFTELRGLQAMRKVEPGADITVGGTRIRTWRLNHPNGSMAYRLDNSGHSFVFATDHEQLETPDEGLAEFARGADILYTEGQYTLAEYEGRVGIVGDPPRSRKGWGHTPIESCIATAIAASVKELHIGHIDPRRNDVGVVEFELAFQQLLRDELAKKSLPPDQCQGRVAGEGMKFRI